MAPTQTQSARAQAAAAWFLTSGIQDAGGGVARYYRGDIGENARVSTEITGYAVSSLVDLYNRLGDPECLRAARRAGDFLLEHAWDAALQVFPFEHSFAAEVPEHLAYFFDSGIIVRGLLALWRATGEAPYLEMAKQTGDSMQRHFVRDGVIHPILHLPEMRPLPWTSQWSRGPGCYQLKSAMAWWDLHSITGEGRYRSWYEEALATSLASHRDFLPAETAEKTMDRLHAYSYFLEGALPASDRAEVRSALQDGIARAATWLREIAPTFERSDAYAQILRARLFADQRGAVPLNRAEAEEEARRIPTFQVSSSNLRFHGGYAFGRRSGAIIPHINPVSTAFCSQAVEMWDDYRAGRDLDLQSLV